MIKTVLFDQNLDLPIRLFVSKGCIIISGLGVLFFRLDSEK